MPIRKRVLLKRAGKPRRRRLLRRLINPSPTFTEMLQAGQLFAGAGGVFKASMAALPELSQYSALYSQYCIKRLEVILLPTYSSQEQNQAQSNFVNPVTTLGVAQSRLAYAINDTSNEPNPLNELSVLEDNGCRVVPILSKAIRLSCAPVADVGVVDRNSILGVSVAESKKHRWLSFDSGSEILHSGISYWISGASTGSAPPVVDVYYRITFSVRDPR